MRSASPRSHRARLQPSRHDTRRLQPATIRMRRSGAASSPAGARRGRGAAGEVHSDNGIGRPRRAVAPVRVRACLTGNRTRRFPGAMRPARRDRQDVCDPAPRSNAGGEAMPRRIVTLVRGLQWVGPDAAAHSRRSSRSGLPVAFDGSSSAGTCPRPGRDVQAEAPRSRPASGSADGCRQVLWDVDGFSSHTRMPAR